ncbi:cytochrome c oxidase assembly protein COX11, mitochondrial [Petromyzon marinus]|uniref:Cytochrome c oxidase assembly protein COX11, mitochondrial n=1 Tax=Petromyzon marinus TaxID=7757 RepID=A0AAJ7TZY4_PETMA|nr:cytochrome c oxidase assembly protein COX11, mitochondrial [Petromyzon marinus]XP_032826111.1 cytochrome c oxidase assembly protein COX11, mitochondrial [Petromyzon marinus]
MLQVTAWRCAAWVPAGASVAWAPRAGTRALGPSCLRCATLRAPLVTRGSTRAQSNFGPGSGPYTRKNRTSLAYIIATVTGMLGLSYAAVPLYRLYCQATGLGGQAVAGHGTEGVATMRPVRERAIRVIFNADVHAGLLWNFRPQQSEVNVVPGETALAFYRAKNPSSKPVVGISTYNVVPFEAGQYFNKIQCFCFEEQRLNPHEEVDMPVFFYIDPEFAEDPRMANVNTITLSYTFFEAKDGQFLSLPGYNK